MAFVVSLNLRRRHLSPSQLAFVALEIEKAEAVLAKQRQEAGANQYASLTERIPEASAGEAREKAADAVGINPRYVSDAKTRCTGARRADAAKPYSYRTVFNALSSPFAAAASRKPPRCIALLRV